MKTNIMERKCLYYKNITEIQYQSHKNCFHLLMTNRFRIVLSGSRASTALGISFQPAGKGHREIFSE